MLEAFGYSDPGCVRSNNEDYYLLNSALDLYLVADGMGGAQAGEHASKLAAETVADFLQQAGHVDDSALQDALREANRRVLRAAEGDPGLHGMGTTLTAALRVGGKLLVANVGDSRVYMYENGSLQAMTEDQTWVHEVGRKLGLGEEALKVHPMRHVLTMAIGVSETLRIQVSSVPILPGALYLLCSDGLHGVVQPEAIREILAAAGTLEDKCHALVQAAKKAGGPDNITVILLVEEPQK